MKRSLRVRLALDEEGERSLVRLCELTDGQITRLYLYRGQVVKELSIPRARKVNQNAVTAALSDEKLTIVSADIVETYRLRRFIENGEHNCPPTILYHEDDQADEGQLVNPETSLSQGSNRGLFDRLQQAVASIL